MTQTISVTAIKKATGKAWSEWLKFFETIKARDLSHKEIALKAYEHGAPGWWAQMLTVTYEQHIGRRVPGQDCDGKFAVSANKTLAGNMDDALDKWISVTNGLDSFSDVAISHRSEVTRTDKWRYWRCGLADGSRINVNIYEKSGDKASMSVQHEKLESTEQVEHWRAFWKNFLTHV